MELSRVELLKERAWHERAAKLQAQREKSERLAIARDSAKQLRVYHERAVARYAERLGKLVKLGK